MEIKPYSEIRHKEVYLQEKRTAFNPASQSAFVPHFDSSDIDCSFKTIEVLPQKKKKK